MNLIIKLEFKIWKINFEENTASCFVKGSGNKLDSHGNLISYCHCNRSGFYNTKCVGQRHLKSQGTSKLNTYCTASIKTITDKLTCEM